MPFKYKLARRLALLKSVALVAALAGVVACEPVAHSLTDPLEASDQIVQLVALPDSVAIDSADSTQFLAFGRTADGDSVDVRVTWATDGGVISRDGLFTPGPVGGTFRVFSRLLVGAVTDTSRVTVRVTKAPAVAEVAVEPASVDVTVGYTVRLVAVVRDADGRALTDRAVTWTSDDPAVAAVDDSGFVRAMAHGSVAITAVSHGFSGSAIMTVHPAATPDAGDWPNAPPQWSVIADQSGSAPVPAIEDGLWIVPWRVAWNVEGNLTAVTDVSAPYSPGDVLQMRYPDGFIGGRGPGMVSISLPSGNSGTYVALWWKPSEPWQAHSTGVNKLQYLKTPSGLLYLAMYGSGPYELRASNVLSGGETWLLPNLNSVAVELGEWHLVEWLVEYTVGGPGRIRWWIDEVPIGDHTIAWTSERLTTYQLNSVWGGNGDAKTQTDYFWYDHVHIRGR